MFAYSRNTCETRYANAHFGDKDALVGGIERVGALLAGAALNADADLL